MLVVSIDHCQALAVAHVVQARNKASLHKFFDHDWEQYQAVERFHDHPQASTMTLLVNGIE